MDYIHQVVDSEKLIKIFDLPLALRGRKVEVIVLPSTETHESSDCVGSAFGCLRKYANPLLIPQENGIWEQITRDKYADR